MDFKEYFNSESDFSDEHSSDDFENFNCVLEPFQFEPERKTAKTKQLKTKQILICSQEKDLVDSRVGSLEWCKCSGCKVEKRNIDCLCCHEVHAIEETKFENQKCVILANEFNLLCLNEAVLKNVLRSLHTSKGDSLEEKPSNRSYRYASYRQFIWWVFDRLGKNNRRVIPSCVIWKIRATFPEENEAYCFYEEGGKD